MSHLQELIDRRYFLRRQIKPLEDELKALDEELKIEMEPGEIIIGSEGVGYSLTVSEKPEYPQKAKEIIAILPPSKASHFISISKASIDRALKDKVITPETAELLNSMATTKESLVIREYIPDESKVI